MVLISVPVEPKKFQKNRGVEGRGEAAISYPLPRPNTPGRSVPEEAKKFQKNRGVEGRGEAAISSPLPRPNTPRTRSGSAGRHLFIPSVAYFNNNPFHSMGMIPDQGITHFRFQKQSRPPPPIPLEPTSYSRLFSEPSSINWPFCSSGSFRCSTGTSHRHQMVWTQSR